MPGLTTYCVYKAAWIPSSMSRAISGVAWRGPNGTASSTATDGPLPAPLPASPWQSSGLTPAAALVGVLPHTFCNPTVRGRYTFPHETYLIRRHVRSARASRRRSVVTPRDVRERRVDALTSAAARRTSRPGCGRGDRVRARASFDRAGRVTPRVFRVFLRAGVRPRRPQAMRVRHRRLSTGIRPSTTWLERMGRSVRKRVEIAVPSTSRIDAA